MGVQVETISPGDGRTFPKHGQTCVVHYTGIATGHPGIIPPHATLLQCGASKTGMTGMASSLSSLFLDLPWRDLVPPDVCT
uniref:Uncharacterized protein n=1 Tax=Nomascus leucogenys TaxID=61853 RepID=A0A2I3HTA2_NOMLE